MTKRLITCIALVLILVSLSAAVPSSTSKKIDGNESLSQSINPANMSTPIDSSLKIDSPEHREINVQELKIVDSGFHQATGISRFGFILKNLNETAGYRISKYQVSAYDNVGRVLGTFESLIQFLFPGERIGIVGYLNIPEDARIDHIQIQVIDGDPIEPKVAKNLLSVENLNYIQDRYAPKVTGVINNSANQTMENIDVSVIFFDETGRLSDGLETHVNFVPAAGKSAFEISSYGTKSPSRMEAFAESSDWSIQQA